MKKNSTEPTIFMDKGTDRIEHEAKVVAIDTTRHLVTVEMLRDGDCGGCPAARLCGMAEEGKDRMDVRDPNASRFQIGEIVRLVGTEALHRKAIMIATVVPCILLMLTMVVTYLLTFSQLGSVLAGVGMTILFYIMLYLGRNRVAHEFTFILQKK